jgi:hypothetical protein
LDGVLDDMKIIKKNIEKECELWEFFKNNLPDSLVAEKDTDGYGVIYGIYIKEAKGFLNRINPFSVIIARVSGDIVELYQPQYYSDVENIINKFENQTGKEVILEYWES